MVLFSPLLIKVIDDPFADFYYIFAISSWDDNKFIHLLYCRFVIMFYKGFQAFGDEFVSAQVSLACHPDDFHK